MATNLDAATRLEQEFRIQQSFIAGRLRRSAFARTTWILGFAGVVMISLTLFQIPNVDGGLPFLLNYEILISFALPSSVGILLNLFIFLMHLLLCINEINFNKNKAQFPNQEFIERCIHRQKNLDTAIRLAEAFSRVFGSSFWVYVFVVGVSGTFIPYQDPNSYPGCSGRLYQVVTGVWLLLKTSIDGLPD